MKFIALIFLSLSLLSCSSTTKTSENSSTFKKISQLKVGASKESDVVSILGQPSQQTVLKNETVWEFHNAENSGQYITIKFKNNSNTVHSILWVLQPNDTIELGDLNKKYSSLDLKASPTVQPNPHSLTQPSNLVDDRLGLSVLYQKTNERIEAIAWFDPTTREPSTQREKETIPYKIDK
ncbi:hypothetical protein [Bdellovibrio sp. BCCA]|uniref:hypothetical protein n=1 Tax=Bdellovibrio sp. BCCA TaxID=3136281 RepID=UPI0030F347C2